MRIFAQKPKAAQRAKCAKSMKPGRAHLGQNRTVSASPRVQRTIGIQAAQRFLQSNREIIETRSGSAAAARLSHDFGRIALCPAEQAIQTKLTVNKLGDKYEQEADRVADQVMRMPAPEAAMLLEAPQDIQRKCAPCAAGGTPCPKCADENEIQLKPLAKQITPLVRRRESKAEEPDEDEEIHAKVAQGRSGTFVMGPDSALAAPQGGGRPLSTSQRAFFEPRFGVDLSAVRIHNGAQAAVTARSLGARAYTLGNHVVFGQGEYRPDNEPGRRLLAHELTHVLQNTGTLRRNIQGQKPTNPLAMRTPWDQLPAAVRRVFQDSFTMRLHKPTGAGTKGLVHWTWNKRTAAQSYNSWQPKHRNAFNRVYIELVATGLWTEVRRITQVFVGAGGAVPGIRFWPKDPVALVALLLSKSFCRDTLMYHIARSKGGSAKWRQMVSVGTEGLHVIPGVETEVHIDAINPVAERAKNGDCRYSMQHILPHVSRDLVEGLRKRGITLFPERRLKPGERTQPGEVQPLLEWRFPMQEQGKR